MSCDVYISAEWKMMRALGKKVLTITRHKTTSKRNK